jgi:hypothetical protein
VAHIGSIKKYEFDFPNALYYPNHLGILGTLTLLDKLSPKATIISEFGSELKGFYIELVETIAKMLNDLQKDASKEEKTFVIPGDLTIVYYVDKHQFLCHNDNKPHDPKELICSEGPDWNIRLWPDVAKELQSSYKKPEESCAYLFTKNASEQEKQKGVWKFCVQRACHKLPHHKPPAS